MIKRVLAFDLGASAGRCILGEFDNSKLKLEEISRFSYEPIIIDQKMHWDIDLIFTSITTAIRTATDRYHIDSLAIDTWGVDYGLIDEQGDLIEPPVHYRDTRTQGMLAEISKVISQARLYEMTGVQLMEINTLFQLKATAMQEPEILQRAKTLLLMPDLLGYLLTGVKQTEMSIASTSQLLNPITKEWNQELLTLVDLPCHIFTNIVTEGNILGTIKSSLQLPEIPVYHVCAHDTASAFASATGVENSFFVSSGTWSLIGVERASPIINEKAKNYNLTNESGIDGTTRLLKNMTGLWIVQELRREFAEQGKDYSYPELEILARATKPFQFFIATDDPRFLASGKMTERIHEFLRESDQKIPENDGELIRCVYESLAFKYKTTFLEIMDIVDKPLTTINMVGGGTQSKLLCEMVANASGMEVIAGPVEATALGNIGVQLMNHGCFRSTEQMRLWIREQSDIKTYTPVEINKWEDEFQRYKTLIMK